MLVCTFLTLCVGVLGAPTPELIDLGYTLDENTQFWPGVQRFNLTDEVRVTDRPGIPWYAGNTFTSSEHVGTHLDAPFHFSKDGWKVADIPLNRLIVPGVLIDVSEKVQDNNSFELRSEDIKAWEDQNAPLPDEYVVLIRFGWSRFYNNRNEYLGFNSSNSSELNFPGISDDAANYIVETGKVYGVGVDVASVDPGNSVTFKTHQILSKANIFGLENVKLENDSLPAKGFTLQIMPMKITQGTGAPCRIVAVLSHK